MNKLNVVSSNVKAIGYDDRTQTLEVEFLNGRVYQYYDISENMHNQFMQASSKGKFFLTYIKDQYPYSRVA